MNPEFELRSREAFSVCGYCTETCVETCAGDLENLWNDFALKKANLFERFGERRDFYGLMWKTENGRYCYLIGIEAPETGRDPEGTVRKRIPSAEYAVATVPMSVGAVEAWTRFYYEILPKAGYTPNAGHGFDFEYYPGGDGGDYNLWTPVVKAPE